MIRLNEVLHAYHRRFLISIWQGFHAADMLLRKQWDSDTDRSGLVIVDNDTCRLHMIWNVVWGWPRHDTWQISCPSKQNIAF